MQELLRDISGDIRRIHHRLKNAEENMFMYFYVGVAITQFSIESAGAQLWDLRTRTEPNNDITDFLNT